MANITGIILTKNEEGNISRAIKSLSFCNEVIVIDDYSTDDTVKIAKKLKAKVYKNHLNNNFAKQRNWGVKKARNEWVFFLDADEMVPRRLRNEISRSIHNNVNGYCVHRVDYLLGRKISHGELGTFGLFGTGKILRLAKKSMGKWRRNVHEYWEVNGAVKELKSELYHYPHPTITEFIKDINVRVPIHAKELKKEGKSVSVVKVVSWPSLKFIYNSTFKLGFIDGTHGFVLNMLMSFHSFLSWSSYWLKENNKS